MHDLKTRASTLSAFTVTVLFALLAAIAVTTPFIPLKTPIEAVVRISRVQTGSGTPDYYDRRRQDIAKVLFDVDADLSPLFNWNTKQLFVYVVAEYETKDHDVNKLVLWDDIIENAHDAKIALRNERSEYAWTQIGEEGLTGLQANVSLHWNVIPYVGMLSTDRGGASKSFKVKPK